VVLPAVNIFLVAGEYSGDTLGAALMRGLRVLAPEVTFLGVGGPKMQAEGLDSLFPMEELSLIGLAEILPRYLHLKRRIRETAAHIAAEAPDAVVTIDSPEFCLRLAAAVKALNPAQRTMHYVAPQVWAWRPGRVHRIARVIDHMLALLPFEPPIFEAAGMTCDMVGHPVAAAPVAGPAEGAAFRARHGIAADAPLVLALPGSRRSVVARLGPVFGETLRAVAEARPGLRVVAPTVPHVAGLLRGVAAGWPGAPVVLEAGAVPADETRAAFAAADAALAASGTVAHELAAAGVPMVIGYDVHPFWRLVLARMMLVQSVTVVNLVTESRVIPEFLGRDFRPGPMARALLPLLDDGPERAAQRAAMDEAMVRLGRGGEEPGLRAARSVLAHLPR
jgi:lipid-A-disaccharide synthase